jgi:hypothetical protein
MIPTKYEAVTEFVTEILPVIVWLPIKMFELVVANELVFILGMVNKDPVPSYMLVPSVWRTLW